MYIKKKDGGNGRRQWMEVRGEEDESLFLRCRLSFVGSLSQLVCVKLKGLLERETKGTDLASNIFQTNSASAHLPHL